MTSTHHHNSDNSASSSHPDSRASVIQSLENILAFARERAAVGAAHEIAFESIINEITAVHAALLHTDVE